MLDHLALLDAGGEPRRARRDAALEGGRLEEQRAQPPDAVAVARPRAATPKSEHRGGPSSWPHGSSGTSPARNATVPPPTAVVSADERGHRRRDVGVAHAAVST